MKTKHLCMTCAALLAVSLLLAPEQALAAGTNMPWESRFEQIADSLSGPTARSLCLIAIVFTGAVMMFGQGGEGLRRSVWVAGGATITFAAASFFISFFGGGAGLSF